MERGYKVEQGEYASFSQGIEDLVDVGDGKLFKGADGVKLFVVDGNPDVAVFLRNRYHRAGVRGGRALDEASGQVSVEYGVGLLARMGLMRYGREMTGALSGGTEILNGMREQEPKSVLDVEKTSGNSQRTPPKALMTAGDQPEPWRLNLMSRRCKGSRSQLKG